MYAAGANGGTAYEQAPSSITVDFSDNVVPSSLSPSDLVLGGAGVGTAKVASLAWVDSHTIKFFLSGSFNASGKVQVSIPTGALTDTQGDASVGFTDSFVIGTNPVTTTTTGTTNPAIGQVTIAAVTIPTVLQPLAVAGPMAIHYGKSHKGSSAHHVTTKAASQVVPSKTTVHPAAHKATHKAPKVAKATHKAAKKTK